MNTLTVPQSAQASPEDAERLPSRDCRDRGRSLEVREGIKEERQLFTLEYR